MAAEAPTEAVPTVLPPATDNPDSLFDLAMNVFVDNVDMWTEPDFLNKGRRFKQEVTLPSEVAERFLMSFQRKFRVNDAVANVFRDRRRCLLRAVKLRNSHVSDDSLLLMLAHKPREVELVQCEYLTRASLHHINSNSENLVSLKIGPVSNVLPQDESTVRSKGYIVNAPNLRKLIISRRGLALFPLLLLRPLSQLTYLDLSECGSLGPIPSHMPCLQTLILHNVYWLEDAVVRWITTLKTLEHLDISQSSESYGKYYHPNQTLSRIVTKLPRLRALDISGTNLAGTGAAVQPSAAPSGRRCDIPGLVNRIDEPLEFLGLYGTLHGACKRHDIPALVITGDANENQILTAAEVYIERPDMVMKVLNDLYYTFRYENNTQIIRALNVVLAAMDNHLSEKHIQISGSATLFYIVKGKERSNISVRMKRRIISALLLGMETHMGDETMMRNGCLTLCQFKIPSDVIFEYEKMVVILMHGVTDVNQEGFVQRIAIYLLNSLACQVDGGQKRFLGERGAIYLMLNLISDRIDRNVCDDVLEVAWSTMWNVTDETPENCQRFLDSKGMDYFLACLKSFPDKEELLRNMMGLLGNVAEVEHLRCYLMTPVFLGVFYDLLNSSSDGIEVSYNAAGVLAHIASDGPRAWAVRDPARARVLDRVAAAIERWDLHAERNINYRSFEPILGLLSAHHTPQCQHWAVWALANLTTVYPDKYCGLVESEGGVELLRTLVTHPAPYARIKELAAQVLHNCHNYKVRREAAAAAASAAAGASPAPSPDN